MVNDFVGFVAYWDANNKIIVSGVEMIKWWWHSDKILKMCGSYDLRWKYTSTNMKQN